MTIRELLWVLMISAVLGTLIVFIMLNMYLGCDSWDNPMCVTPREFLEVVF